MVKPLLIPEKFTCLPVNAIGSTWEVNCDSHCMNGNSFTHFCLYCEVYFPAEILHKQSWDPISVEMKGRVNDSFSTVRVDLGEAIQGQSCNCQTFSDTLPALQGVFINSINQRQLHLSSSYVVIHSRLYLSSKGQVSGAGSWWKLKLTLSVKSHQSTECFLKTEFTGCICR